MEYFNTDFWLNVILIALAFITSHAASNFQGAYKKAESRLFYVAAIGLIGGFIKSIFLSVFGVWWVGIVCFISGVIIAFILNAIINHYFRTMLGLISIVLTPVLLILLFIVKLF